MMLWVVQVLVALVFLLAGGMKLAMSLAALAQVSPLPPLFLKFVAVCEILGAFGLILPGLVHIRPGLTPLAAAGLVIIMIGATIASIIQMGVASAVLPVVVGILAAFVAYGRWRVAPLSAQASSLSASGEARRA
jgi:hypothetical protein